MDKEQKKAFEDSGMQAAYVYNGAFGVFGNSKQAERIVFLFFSALIFGQEQTASILFKMFTDKE
ncbi:hypothetical protein AALC25_17255 [Lachnospiraceae bacterium 29-84]